MDYNPSWTRYWTRPAGNMEQDQSVEVSEAVAATSERPLYEALLEGGVSASRAYAATQCVRDLAGGNTTARLLAAIQAQGAELNARIDTQGAELNAKIDAQGAQLNARIDAQGAQLNARIDALGAELNARIDALGAELKALGAKFEAVTGALRWMMGIVIALLAALVVLVTLALQELSRTPGRETGLGQAVAAPTGTSEPAGASAPDEAAAPAP